MAENAAATCDHCGGEPHEHVLDMVITDGCGRNSDKHFDYVEAALEGRLPSFWQTFHNSRDSLRRIFDFYCGLRQFTERLQAGKEDALALTALLYDRLGHRIYGGIVTTPPEKFHKIIEDYSNRQIDLMIKLGWPLLGPALDTFVSGSLSRLGVVERCPLKLKKKMDAIKLLDSVVEADVELPFKACEPEGAGFFHWAEFGIAALQVSPERHWPWLRVLPLLLRAQYIFMHTYVPRDEHGIPNRFPKRIDYRPCNYMPAQLDTFAAIDFSRLLSLADFEAAASDCAARAFGGETK